MDIPPSQLFLGNDVIKGAMDTSLFIGLCLGAYLIGSIPVGYLVAKARGTDIRKVGSGNIGSTNVTRVLGMKWGALVALLDFMKSYLPALLLHHFYPVGWQLLVITLMPVIGHIFSIFLGFRGGKGVATTFGLLAFYFGLPWYALFMLIWYLAVKFTKLMSLVNLIVGLLLPLAFWIKYQTAPYVLFGLVVCALIWWSHRANIKRLLAGRELPTNY